MPILRRPRATSHGRDCSGCGRPQQRAPTGAVTAWAAITPAKIIHTPTHSKCRHPRSSASWTRCGWKGGCRGTRSRPTAPTLPPSPGVSANPGQPSRTRPGAICWTTSPGGWSRAPGRALRRASCRASGGSSATCSGRGCARTTRPPRSRCPRSGGRCPNRSPKLKWRPCSRPPTRATASGIGTARCWKCCMRLVSGSRNWSTCGSTRSTSTRG